VELFLALRRLNAKYLPLECSIIKYFISSSLMNLLISPEVREVSKVLKSKEKTIVRMAHKNIQRLIFS
jgi:hypothetical protein